MNLSTQETITAVASSRTPALRGVVRLSGPKSAEAVRKIAVDSSADQIPLAPAKQAVYSIRLNLYGEVRSVPARLYLWPDGRGYTGEESAEIHLAGAAPILDRLVWRLCETEQVRLAEPGEFTLRAFLNGRIDLTRAEAVLGVIDAAGEGALQTALVQLAGNLARPLDALRELLLNTLADWEAGLDFTDEEIAFLSPEELRTRIDAALDAIDRLSAKMTGRALSGVERKVVLYGEANAGKSTLFNRLNMQFGSADTPEAIVSARKGTTRDWLEAHVVFGDYPVRLIDTAGLRNDLYTSDKEVSPLDTLDQAALHKTGEAVSGADLILYCLSPDCHFSEYADSCFYFNLQSKEIQARILLVRTKQDLIPSFIPSTGFDKKNTNEHQTKEVFLSAQTGEGISRLVEKIIAYFTQTESGEAVPSTAQRCRSSLDDARRALQCAKSLIGDDEIFVAAELRSALDSIGRITSAVPADDLLDRIFSRFCLGK